ncbi:uncharacterized protein LOC129769298 isoform X3 [Toxorhynchites rutilus septentrionalis]|uniref:uncharacterized protein LOC129769298 isoform X3 n=1 Tax=Toxorhynchites rutilus septentrionalis TaxID=329112 RepID=UPI002479F891|nr:uncharacterized protein LOC129769298 isoform X3 [Toxorhynchites rutilus septentrionalis]
MSDNSFELDITKYIAEQKRLLALERERFAVERIKILEPDSVELGGNSAANNVKESKNDLNSKLVQNETCDDNKTADPPESASHCDYVAPENHEECPIDKLLRIKCSKSVDLPSPSHRIGPSVKDTASPKPFHESDGLDPLTPNQQKQQDEMEQWVSDTFYSYFPSFNKNQNEKKSMLSRARQADYQEYLKNVNQIANAIPQVMSKHQQYIEKYGNHHPPVNEKGTNTPNPPSSTKKVTYLSPSEYGGTSEKMRHQNPVLAKTLASDTTSQPAASSFMRKDTVDRRNRMLAEVGVPPFKHMKPSTTATNTPKILYTTKFVPTNERGSLVLNEENRRKLEYQKDLIKQIDEKRREVERLREKEKLEEEMLTSRLEQQLKTMQLEEELEREKQRSEKIRIANEQNHIRRLQLLSKLENDHKLFNPYDDQRKTLSENGKEAYVDPSQQKAPGEKVYRFFSNSAQNEKPSSFSSTSLSSEMGYDSSSESMGYDRYQYCKNCRTDIDRSFLPQSHGPSRHLHQHQHQHKTTPKMQRKGEDHCLNCRKRIEKLCTKCDRVMKRSVKRNLCTICQQSLDNSRLQREAQLELKRQRSKLLRSMEMLHNDDETPGGDDDSPPPVPPSPTNPYKIIDIQYHESDNDHDLAVLNPVIVRNNYKKPFSLNIEKDSLFHPSKKTQDPKVSVNIRNGEVFVDNKLSPSGTHKPPPDDTDDLTTDEMDERISKYIKHYNTLWMKRGMRKNNLISQKSNSTVATGKLGPLPPLSPAKVYVSDRPDNVKSDAMKATEKKWDIPAVERLKVSPGSPRVLTQLGAIRKQLQLEQLQMDQTFTDNH